LIVANSALMLRSDAKSIASRSMLQFTRSFVQAGASFDKAQDEVEGIGLGVTKKHRRAVLERIGGSVERRRSPQFRLRFASRPSDRCNRTARALYLRGRS
jgi:hypothetical protein